MSEVRVEKRPVPAAPMFPVGRFFGMNPFTMMREFTEEMDNIFKGNIPAIPAAPEVWAPKVDVQRCNGDLVVTAELPGLKKEEVKVEMTEEALVLTGERKSSTKRITRDTTGMRGATVSSIVPFRFRKVSRPKRQRPS